MHPQTVFTKTAKGVLEIRNKTIRLPRDLGAVFISVDGKSTVADLVRKSGVDEAKFHEALDKLVSDGYIKIFSTPAAAPSAAEPQTEGFDLDFTSPEAVVKLNTEA